MREAEQEEHRTHSDALGLQTAVDKNIPERSNGAFRACDEARQVGGHQEHDVPRGAKGREPAEAVGCPSLLAQ